MTEAKTISRFVVGKGLMGAEACQGFLDSGAEHQCAHVMGEMSVTQAASGF